MRPVSIFVIVLLSIILVSTTACEPETYHLDIGVSGQGVVSPSAGTYEDGRVIAVTAIPASGWEFDRWEGFYNSSENPVYIRMNSDKALNAYFTELPIPTLTPTTTPTPTPTPTLLPKPSPTPTPRKEAAPPPIAAGPDSHPPEVVHPGT